MLERMVAMVAAFRTKGFLIVPQKFWFVRYSLVVVLEEC